MSIISAIFLLLLFAALAAIMAQVVSSSNTTAAQDVQGSRALQAAQAGVEWGLFQLDPNGDSATLPSCFATNPTVLTTISDYQVSVRCTPYPGATTTYAEGGKTLRVFEITATARATASQPLTIEREARVRVEKCRDSTITVAPFDC
ncbi:hypothetical protein GH865_05425 [Rhodocyclus tenuis]|uniref:hypothetical protein n=1 Tax=Rhodocyclus gracilis TaxID=2929842 RepID=UPI001298E0A9|nr:hypothetical protein [Rhodocyclus gracilis]MRD72691.1 hypothetical protein [Rhodocyclus gracilis]